MVEIFWYAVVGLGFVYALASGIAMLIAPRRWHRAPWGFRGGGGYEFINTRFGEWTYRVTGIVLVLVSGYFFFRFLTDPR